LSLKLLDQITMRPAQNPITVSVPFILMALSIFYPCF